MDTRTFFEVARNGRKVDLDEVCGDIEKVRKANEDYTELRQRKIIYGDRTGYGEKVGHIIEPDKDKEKQRNLVLGLNCGSGELLREDQVRAAMLIRLLVLSRGHSCVRPAILSALSEMLNSEGRIPLVPSLGSIGASGDLVPSSYYAIPIMNEVGLEGREGLALVNGTHFMTGIATLVVEDFEYLFGHLLKLFAVLFQCHNGIEDVSDEDLHLLKEHEEQRDVAAFFRKILNGSKLLTGLEALTNASADELKALKPIQDRYSLRALAQEMGPIVHRIRDSEAMIKNERNSVSDNPVLINGEIKQGAHFDGTWTADAVECLKRAIKRAAYNARAYMRSTTDSKLNHGLLPTYLVAGDEGLCNGLQGLDGLSFDAAYASLVKDSIPDDIFAMNDHEGGNQDVVSMGMNSALSASKMIDKLTTLTAMTMITTRQAVHLLRVENRLSPETKAYFRGLARLIDPLDGDRSLHNELRELERKLFYHEI
ncbi:MAG: aromatic amino acid ammonia-lyase [bacterium]|nr:aromatic amino acid ammonia-lyase [bacterium]